VFKFPLGLRQKEEPNIGAGDDHVMLFQATVNAKVLAIATIQGNETRKV